MLGPLLAAPMAPVLAFHNPHHTGLKGFVGSQALLLDCKFMRSGTWPFLSTAASPGPGM